MLKENYKEFFWTLPHCDNSSLGGSGTGLYLIIWQDGKWTNSVLIFLALLQAVLGIWIFLGWQLLISPFGQGFWYLLLGHNELLLVIPF